MNEGNKLCFWLWGEEKRSREHVVGVLVDERKEGRESRIRRTKLYIISSLSSSV